MSIPPPASGPSGSRLPPPVVPPVVLGGMRLQQRAGQIAVDGQVGGLLDAYDAKGNRVWTLKVYDNVREPEIEGDVQDVFFRSMDVQPDGRLRIVDESGRGWLVDVSSRTVAADGGPGKKSGREGLLTAD